MNPEEQRTSCPGFLDEYGVWNNGFECPPLGGQRRICCGTDAHLYCCSIGHSFSNRQEKSSITITEPTFSFAEKLNAIFFTLPILLTCILIVILLLIIIMIILFICYRCRQQNLREREVPVATKQALLVEHLPFTPPHHPIYFNETSPQTCLLHSQIKDPLTASTTSSKSNAFASGIYYNDWQEFFNTTDQPMNLYPTMSTHSNEIPNENSYLHPHCLFNGKQQIQDDIIV
ncbi:unnamed protein product [Adineta ricciae]|uniref:Shisa N-terminal domain-containing protein n=1 Tax=Adineta ricciae TaxID=249248 RepID=A0A813S2U6_ADIRI|nr:unnamed protein product [Adineta ricciae]